MFVYSSLTTSQNDHEAPFKFPLEWDLVDNVAKENA